MSNLIKFLHTIFKFFTLIEVKWASKQKKEIHIKSDYMKIAENSFQNDIQTSAVNKRVVVSTVKPLHNS